MNAAETTSRGWVLHVGLPKTGTTSFQTHLRRLVSSSFDGRPIPALAVPPRADPLESHLLAWWCQPERWQEFDDETQAALAALPTRLADFEEAQTDAGALFSSEALFWELRTDEHLERLSELLNGRVSSIVIVLRDVLHIAKTLWLTHVVEGIEFRTFDSWVEVHGQHLTHPQAWLARTGVRLGDPKVISMDYDASVNYRLCQILGLPSPDPGDRSRASGGFTGLGDVFLAISQSDSPVAGDVRRLIREYLERGTTTKGLSDSPDVSTWQ